MVNRPPELSDVFRLARKADSLLAEIEARREPGPTSDLVLPLRMAREQMETKLLKLDRFVRGAAASQRELSEACSEVREVLERLESQLPDRSA